MESRANRPDVAALKPQDTIGVVMNPLRLPSPSLLFCPADRPDRYAKALQRADLVVLDLEDAVAPADRPAARAALIANPIDPTRVSVRINAAGTGDHAADLAAIARTQYRTVMLAKTESAEQVAGIAPLQVIGLCETPQGVLAAPSIAAVSNVIALMWGSEDLAAALGSRSSRGPDGRLTDLARHARASILLAAKTCDRQAIDTVYTHFADLAGLAREAAEAAEDGFDLKACIHPNQTTVVVDAYRPSAADTEWAQRVINASTSGGVRQIDGKMIDAPIIRQAERTLAWHNRPN